MSCACSLQRLGLRSVEWRGQPRAACRGSRPPTGCAARPARPQEGDTAGEKLSGALINALIFVGVVAVMTFVLVLLFKYGVSAAHGAPRGRGDSRSRGAGRAVSRPLPRRRRVGPVLSTAASTTLYPCLCRLSPLHTHAPPPSAPQYTKVIYAYMGFAGFSIFFVVCGRGCRLSPGLLAAALRVQGRRPACAPRPGSLRATSCAWAAERSAAKHKRGEGSGTPLCPPPACSWRASSRSSCCRRPACTWTWSPSATCSSTLRCARGHGAAACGSALWPGARAGACLTLALCGRRRLRGGGVPKAPLSLRPALLTPHCTLNVQ